MLTNERMKEAIDAMHPLEAVAVGSSLVKIVSHLQGVLRTDHQKKHHVELIDKLFHPDNSINFDSLEMNQSDFIYSLLNGELDLVSATGFGSFDDDDAPVLRWSFEDSHKNIMELVMRFYTEFLGGNDVVHNIVSLSVLIDDVESVIGGVAGDILVSTAESLGFGNVIDDERMCFDTRWDLSSFSSLEESLIPSRDDSVEALRDALSVYDVESSLDIMDRYEKRHGEPIDCNKNNFLHTAAKLKDDAVICRMVKDGGDINKLNNDNKTPMMLAIFFSNIVAVDALIGLGAEAHSSLEYFKSSKTNDKAIHASLERHVLLQSRKNDRESPGLGL